jgi:hypothetical protein
VIAIATRHEKTNHIGRERGVLSLLFFIIGAVLNHSFLQQHAWKEGNIGWEITGHSWERHFLLQRYHGRGDGKQEQGRLFLIVTTTLPTLSFTTDYSRKLPESKKDSFCLHIVWRREILLLLRPLLN